MEKEQPRVPQAPSQEPPEQSDMAVRLLQLQQRLEAWEGLYNEEISELQRALRELKADYVRQYETRRTVRKAPKRRTTPKSPPTERRRKSPQ